MLTTPQYIPKTAEEYEAAINMYPTEAQVRGGIKIPSEQVDFVKGAPTDLKRNLDDLLNDFRPKHMQVDITDYVEYDDKSGTIIRDGWECQQMIHTQRLGYRLTKEDVNYLNSLKKNSNRPSTYTPQVNVVVERNYNAYQDWLDKMKQGKQS